MYSSSSTSSSHPLPNQGSLPELVFSNALNSSVAILRPSARGDEIKIWDCLTNTVESAVTLGAMSSTVASFVCAQSATKKQPAKEYIVVGSSLGKIVVVDPLTSDVVFRLSSSKDASITSMCPLKSGFFVTGHSNGRVNIWMLSTDGSCCLESTISELQDVPITSLDGAFESSLLAIGQDVISIYNLNDKTIVKTLPGGHSTGQIVGLKFCASKDRLVSCAANDLSMLVWDVLSERVDPVYSIPLPDSPLHLSSSTSSSILLVVCNSLIKLIYGIDGEASKRVKSIENMNSVSFSSDPIIAGYVCKGDRILTIRGSLSSPSFEYLPLFVEGSIISGVLERPPCSSSNLNEGTGQAKKRSRKGEPEVISGASAPLRVKPDSSLEQTADLTESVVVDETFGGLKSITNLLIQGLRSRNPDLIESGLNLTDDNMIIESIEKLPQSVAFILLEELVNRIVKRPARVLQLGSWVKCLHMIHGDFIISNHNYKAVMRPLQDCIAIHTESRNLLLSLQTTVDALMQDSLSLDASNEQAGPKMSKNFVEIIDTSSDASNEEEEEDSVSCPPDHVNFANPHQTEPSNDEQRTDSDSDS